MICKKCGLEGMIDQVQHRVTGDNSPDTETHVFVVQKFVCRNPQCEDYGKEIGEEESRLV